MLQAAPRGIIIAMDKLPDVKVLIASGQEDCAQRWAEMLRQGGRPLSINLAEMPQDEQPDVILTDENPLDCQEPPGSMAGVIRIGPVGETEEAADVWLPVDVTGRELRLACRLLAQIVHLRRQRQSDAKLRRRLCEEALTDPLSGLPNRRAWDQTLDQRLATMPDSMLLCLAIFDLDHFKHINEIHGYAVGDVVLRSAGRAIRENLRNGDFIARLGGDEFGLLLWVSDESVAGRVIDRVRAALPSGLAEAATHSVTASAGYCIAAGDRSSDVVFSAADDALREAKLRGRDRTVVGVRSRERRLGGYSPADVEQPEHRP